MTITAKQTSTQLRAAVKLIDRLPALPAAIAAIHQAIDDGTDEPERDRTEDAGIRAKGGHSDPTADSALRLAAKHERHLEDVEMNLATLTLAAGNLLDIVNRWTPRADVTPSVRCSGGRTVEEWSRPDCGNWAAETSPGSGRLRGDGLCDACRVRKHRFEQSEIVA